jgi:DNA-binding NarL/FixJ family response regulator
MHSKLLAELDFTNIREHLGVTLDDDDLERLSQLKSQRSVAPDHTLRPARAHTLKEHFDTLPRNEAILSAVADGYTQAEVARYVGLSRSMVSKVCGKQGK